MILKIYSFSKTLGLWIFLSTLLYILQKNAFGASNLNEGYSSIETRPSIDGRIEFYGRYHKLWKIISETDVPCFEGEKLTTPTTKTLASDIDKRRILTWFPAEAVLVSFENLAGFTFTTSDDFTKSYLLVNYDRRTEIEKLEIGKNHSGKEYCLIRAVAEDILPIFPKYQD